jgi:pyroglutamyl-peptidase
VSRKIIEVDTTEPNTGGCMKILITAFDPFGGEKINAAYEAVKLLPVNIAGAEIIRAELPTVFRKCAEILELSIIKYQPDAAICVGQAGGRSDISMEKVAINLADASIPDNEHQQPSDEVLIEDGPAAYFSTLPLKAMVKNIKEHGIPASISYTAGTFVCNDVMYRLMSMIERKYYKMRGGFVHVPLIDSQLTDKPNNSTSMPVETIAKGLEYAIEAVVENAHA